MRRLDNNNVLLISFYNPKSLGLRYLENALRRAGYNVSLVFFKNFNSIKPEMPSDKELQLLISLIDKLKPMLIGMSVMTSLYLEAVEMVNTEIKARTDAPLVWGGVYATMFPEKCMDFADFILRGEGEDAIVELCDVIRDQTCNFGAIKNLVYRSGEKIITNEQRDLISDLDTYGIPNIGGNNKYVIDNNAIVNKDPQLYSRSYETSASRGCPFACSYCCTANLRRISYGKGNYLRNRSVDNVIEELLNAKAKMKRLNVIHFWDEIFHFEDEWTDKFVSRYKKEINLPFEIWGHPLRTDKSTISKLVDAGLYKVVMGIQSGSPYIRKEIFNRPEKQEDIINACNTLTECKVPHLIYDFMLRHPFETHESLQETFHLCLQFKHPFELQLHGLNFLPGTDIVKRALEMELVSQEDMDRFTHAPIKEQYDMYWALDNQDPVSNYWYKLIYLTQFRRFRNQCLELAKDEPTDENHAKLDKLVKHGKMIGKFRYYYNKGTIVFKGTFAR